MSYLEGELFRRGSLQGGYSDSDTSQSLYWSYIREEDESYEIPSVISYVNSPPKYNEPWRNPNTTNIGQKMFVVFGF